MSENTADTLSGLFKEVYSDTVEHAIPESMAIANDTPFVPQDQRPGGKYHQPVKLTRAHGWTLNGTSGGAYALNDAEPSIVKQAELLGSHFTIRETIGYPEVSRLLKSQGASRKRAFASGTSYIVEAMTETAHFVKELQFIYGQDSVGTVDSKSGSGTSQTITFTSGTFIPALWSGMENGFIDVYTSGGSKRNSSGQIQVTAVDVDNLQITVEGTEAELDAISSTDEVYLRGTKSNGMVGLKSILSNTGSLFGIDASTYSLWAGNTYSAASGSLMFAKLLQALNKPVNRGMYGTFRTYVSPKTWTDMQNDLAALRRYSDRAGGKLEQGAKSLQYYGQSGAIEIKPHIFVMPNFALGFPKGKCKRIGATDFTYKIPGSNDRFFDHLPDKAGYGLRGVWDQAIFMPCPSYGLLINNIVNSDDA